MKEHHNSFIPDGQRRERQEGQRKGQEGQRERQRKRRLPQCETRGCAVDSRKLKYRTGTIYACSPSSLGSGAEGQSNSNFPQGFSSVLKGPRKIPTLWSHVPDTTMVSYTETVPQIDMGNQFRPSGLRASGDSVFCGAWFKSI